MNRLAWKMCLLSQGHSYRQYIDTYCWKSTIKMEVISDITIIIIITTIIIIIIYLQRLAGVGEGLRPSLDDLLVQVVVKEALGPRQAGRHGHVGPASRSTSASL